MPRSGRLPVPGEGLSGSGVPLTGARGIPVAHPRVCTTNDRTETWPPGSKCAKSIQSGNKKIYNSGGIQGWAQAAHGSSCLLCGGSSVGQGHPGPCKSRVLGAAGQRHWWGPRGPAGRPDSLRLWHLGPAPLIPPRMPRASVAVAYGCGQALPQQGVRAAGGPVVYESSPRISFTKAAMSVFLVLCKVKKGCSISSR